MPSQDAIYRFGLYELRTRTRELYKHGIRLRLRPQPFQVLHALVERAGDVVTREEFRKELWSSDTFVDFEHGLNNSIKELRGVLGDSIDEARYIETLPKLGYRLVVPVEVERAASLEPVAPGTVKQVKTTAVEAASHEPGRTAKKRAHWALPVGLAAILILGLAGYSQWARTKAQRQRANERRMLAVLPFDNLTGDASQDYFSDGLTEEMIAQLGRLDPQHLGVIARTSVMHYKHSQDSLEQIGRELGVQYVLEGSFRRDAEQVRISAQLIQLKDQTHMWSRQYDRELSGLLPLQGEIAQEIADEIQLTLGNPRQAVAHASAEATKASYEAYDLYLKGQYFWNKRSVEGFQRALAYFQQAIAKDPNYAPAYAGLANSYTLLIGYSGSQPSQYMPQARAAALRALEIDANLAEAHTALALVVQNYDWDWQTAEKEYRQAIELNPNYATAHHWYAEHLMWRGRFEEALRESERARRLDPLSLIIAVDNGAILYNSRQYDRSIERLRAVLEMDPNFSRAGIVWAAYVEKGMFEDALLLSEKGRQRAGEGPVYWSQMAYLYGRSGQREKAWRAFERMQQFSRREPLAPLTLLWAHLGIGDEKEAFADLGKAYAERSNWLVSLKVEPGFDPLRGDPRFQDLLRRVGLAD